MPLVIKSPLRSCMTFLYVVPLLRQCQKPHRWSIHENNRSENLRVWTLLKEKKKVYEKNIVPSGRDR